MPLLQWKSQYSVGIEAVDHEHRELIDLINRIYDRIAGEGDQAAVTVLFGDLLKGITSHFALEEQFMRAHHYDQLRQHKADHERLIDDIRDIMDDFEATAVVDGETLAKRLDQWFSRHFETHDGRLHKAFGDHPH